MPVVKQVVASLDDDEQRIARPFEGWDAKDIIEKAQEFIEETGIDPNEFPHLRRGAILAASPLSYSLRPRPTQAEANQAGNKSFGDSQFQELDEEGYVLVNESEKTALDLEKTGIEWNTFFTRLRAYPLTVYMVMFCCSLGAIVQGFDESAVNGAQVFYSRAFHINGTTTSDGSTGGDSDASIRLGLVNSAPYLVSALACLFVNPLNRLFQGRRGVIFVTCFISSISCLCQSLTSSWKTLFAVRLILGLGIGPKSATVPIYASECAPKSLRGALVMMWQMWTAFGIMLGYVFGLAFWSIGGNQRLDGDVNLPSSWNWRLMLAAPALPPLIPMLYVFTLPESPRYILQTAIRLLAESDHQSDQDAGLKNVAKCIKRAHNSLKRLNKTELQATRELFGIYYSLKQENMGRDHRWFKTSIWELFKRQRSRHALSASVTVMFLQQFCGVNVLAYYSTTVLQSTLPSDEQLTNRSPYLYSLGFGIINFVCALPAIPLMDLWGRRRLLLSTFPFLAICQFAMAAVPRDSTSGMAAAMYLFCVFYSAAEGPIPFVYSSESFPLYHRDMAMGFVTGVTWIFNFTLAVTWPLFLDHFMRPGAFSWYGGWCVVGWFMIYFLVRETKGVGLEEMGEIFNPPSRVYASFAWEELQWFLSRPFMSSHERSLKPRPPILQNNPRYKAWKNRTLQATPEEHEMQNY